MVGSMPFQDPPGYFYVGTGTSPPVPRQHSDLSAMFNPVTVQFTVPMPDDGERRLASTERHDVALEAPGEPRYRLKQPLRAKAGLTPILPDTSAERPVLIAGSRARGLNDRGQSG
jgi:hypothetical protein